jgi:hypothetical protein
MPLLLRKALVAALTQPLAFSLCISPALAQSGCQSQSRYNPIAENHQLNITSVANGIFAFADIRHDVAKSILPDGFKFIDNIWKGYAIPLLVRAIYVHDIRAPYVTWRDHHAVDGLPPRVIHLTNVAMFPDDFV